MLKPKKSYMEEQEVKNEDVVEVKRPKIVYDPTKNYRWEPTDKFTLTGENFMYLYHMLHQEINVPGGASIAMKTKAHDIIMDILKKGVVRGRIKEMDTIASVSSGDSLQQQATKMFAQK